MRVLEQTRKIQVLVADLQVIMFRTVAFIRELERIQDFDHTKFVTRKRSSILDFSSLTNLFFSFLSP